MRLVTYMGIPIIHTHAHAHAYAYAYIYIYTYIRKGRVGWDQFPLPFGAPHEGSTSVTPHPETVKSETYRHGYKQGRKAGYTNISHTTWANAIPSDLLCRWPQQFLPRQKPTPQSNPCHWPSLPCTHPKSDCAAIGKHVKSQSPHSCLWAWIRPYFLSLTCNTAVTCC